MIPELLNKFTTLVMITAERLFTIPSMQTASTLLFELSHQLTIIQYEYTIQIN